MTGTEGEEVHDSEDAPDADTEPGRLRNVLEWVLVLGGAVAVALLLRAYVVKAFKIPSESMEQTLQIDDRILVNRTSYWFGELNRGDVVVFRRPDNQPGEIRDLVKRVIGLEGETVSGVDSVVYIDGVALDEPYLDDDGFSDFAPVAVPPGAVFVMGDNRDESFDSRRFGPVEVDRIAGRAFITYWPLDRLGGL